MPEPMETDQNYENQGKTNWNQLEPIIITQNHARTNENQSTLMRTKQNKLEPFPDIFVRRFEGFEGKKGRLSVVGPES